MKLFFCFFSFSKPCKVRYADVVLWTRQLCCRLRYNDVCLYANGNKVACTPKDHGDPGRFFNFKYLNIDDTPVIASEFKIMWSDEIGSSGQIEELFFHYIGKRRFNPQFYFD